MIKLTIPACVLSNLNFPNTTSLDLTSANAPAGFATVSMNANKDTDIYFYSNDQTIKGQTFKYNLEFKDPSNIIILQPLKPFFLVAVNCLVTSVSSSNKPLKDFEYKIG